MSQPSLKELLEAGVHFGHETKRWNPKMAGNIFTAKEKIHIIDLEKTESALKEATAFVKDLGKAQGQIIFLGTKRQAADIVKEQAERVGAMYLTTRWVGGLFTNFEQVQKNLAKLSDLEEKSKDDRFTKKEQLLMTREVEKLIRNIGGVRTMTKLPEAIFIVDSRKEDIAVKEARKMGVKIVAIVDTNGDPTTIDYPIPGNDDAIRAISILVKAIADSYDEGKNTGEKKSPEEKVEKVEEVSAPVAEKAKAKVEKEEKPKKTTKKVAAKKETKSKKEKA
ncbi:MAG TPA: 30S ribosomal protein S2 [Candidatus Saccharimonadales bacterium]|nr:30S ribosomal protein S2 [Candidatus Saccharimonadales bacterium]